MIEGLPQDQARGGSSKRFSEDYHDYVFRDGKLVGDFDNMYRHAKGVPWDQDQRCNHWYAETGMLMLKEYAPYETILEIGCGLGYIAAKLKGLGSNSVDACDVSAEAIERACRLQPGINFYVDDITLDSFRSLREYDLVVIRDVFWYVFPEMETVVRNISACGKQRGFLYLSQSFPALHTSFVGKEVIPSPDALLGYFQNYELLHTALLRNHLLLGDGPMLHALGRKRG